MKKSKIDWCDMTWNPVTGCKRGCSYCYAKKCWDNRFKKKYRKEFTDIIFHEGRLLDPLRKKAPQIVFVGSMSDIEYWGRSHLQRVIDVCKEAKQHTFMFLSKEPSSYMGYDWPENTMQGLTLTKCDTFGDSFCITTLAQHLPRPYLSIEPLLGNFFPSSSFARMEKIIVGAMTRPATIKPKHHWIQSIIDNAPADKIFWKDNITKYLPERTINWRIVK